MCTLTNGEDPDEMSQNEAFNQGLPCGSVASEGIKLNMIWLEKVKIGNI